MGGGYIMSDKSVIPTSGKSVAMSGPIIGAFALSFQWRGLQQLVV